MHAVHTCRLSMHAVHTCRLSMHACVRAQMARQVDYVQNYLRQADASFAPSTGTGPGGQSFKAGLGGSFAPVG